MVLNTPTKHVGVYTTNPVWGNFLSLFSQFYEVTIFESTYAIDERKNAKCISRC
jgi:hypothetical protein